MECKIFNNTNLKWYLKKSFISFFRQGLIDDLKRNQDWCVYINTSATESDSIYFQGALIFENNYPPRLLIVDTEQGSISRSKHYLKEVQFATLSWVNGVERLAGYRFCNNWEFMY